MDSITQRCPCEGHFELVRNSQISFVKRSEIFQANCKPWEANKVNLKVLQECSFQHKIRESKITEQNEILTNAIWEKRKTLQ